MVDQSLPKGKHQHLYVSSISTENSVSEKSTTPVAIKFSYLVDNNAEETSSTSFLNTSWKMLPASSVSITIQHGNRYGVLSM